MARLPREYRLETREARAKLKVRGEPYWRAIVPGTFLGYRKGKRSAAWVVRQRAAIGGYNEQRVGTPDDEADADGRVVLSYAQAVKASTTPMTDRAPRHYGDGLTINAVMQPYIDEHLAGKGSQSVTRQQHRLHIESGIGRLRVTECDAPTLRKWHKAMASKARTIRGKPQPFDQTDPTQVRARRATANRVLTMVKAALNMAWKDDRLPADLPTYWMKVDPFALGEDPEPRMLEADEITRLLNAADRDLRELLQGALMTGARRGELLALRVQHYDPDTQTVRIYQSKTGKTLTQPLTPEGVALFDRLTAGREPDAHIFTRANGNAWQRHDVGKPMVAAVKAAKLDDVSFKDTRATYGKLLLIATGNIELVAKALGHSDSRITRKHYARYVPSELSAAVARLPALGFATDNKVSRIGKNRRAKA